MNPWNLVGWIVVGVLALVVVLPLAIKVGLLVAELVSDSRKARRIRRAHKGKVRCDYREPGPDGKQCVNIATRKVPGRRFACEEHFNSRSLQGPIVSFAFWLDHAKPHR